MSFALPIVGAAGAAGGGASLALGFAQFALGAVSQVAQFKAQQAAAEAQAAAQQANINAQARYQAEQAKMVQEQAAAQQQRLLLRDAQQQEALNRELSQQKRQTRIERSQQIASSASAGALGVTAGQLIRDFDVQRSLLTEQVERQRQFLEIGLESDFDVLEAQTNQLLRQPPIQTPAPITGPSGLGLGVSLAGSFTNFIADLNTIG